MVRIDRERKTQGSLSNFGMNYISDIKAGLINDDEFVDVIINTTIQYGSNELFVYFGKEGNNGSNQVLIYDQVKVDDGLFNGKIKIADLNNDGQPEIANWFDK